MWLLAELDGVGCAATSMRLAELSVPSKRHVLYAMSACVVGVLLSVPELFAAGWPISSRPSRVVAVVGRVLVRCSGVRRLVGVGSPASVLVVADRLTVEDAVADRAGLGSSVVVGVCLVESLGDRWCRWRGCRCWGVLVMWWVWLRSWGFMRCR